VSQNTTPRDGDQKTVTSVERDRHGDDHVLKVPWSWEDRAHEPYFIDRNSIDVDFYWASLRRMAFRRMFTVLFSLAYGRWISSGGNVEDPQRKIGRPANCTGPAASAFGDRPAAEARKRELDACPQKSHPVLALCLSAVRPKTVPIFGTRSSRPPRPRPFSEGSGPPRPIFERGGLRRDLAGAGRVIQPLGTARARAAIAFGWNEFRGV